MNKFENWWHNVGSGILPKENEDREELTKRVCENFYQYMENPCKTCALFSEEKKRNTIYCVKLCNDYKPDDD